MWEDTIELYFGYAACEGGTDSGTSPVTVFGISTVESSGSVVKLGKKNTTDTRYIQKPSVSYIHYVPHSIPHHKMFQMNFNIDIWSSHSNTSEDACLLDTVLHHWASSRTYQDTTGLAYMVKQLKEDPRRLASSTLMLLTFYVPQPYKVSFLLHTNYGYGEPLECNMKFSYKHLVSWFQRNLFSKFRDK
jgi:hypothetical protein